MVKNNIHIMMLAQYARMLYNASRQINIYIYLLCDENVCDVKKLKSEINKIKQLIECIEIESESIR